MTPSPEINLPLGQGGSVIETEQDPNSTNIQALTNAGDDACKHCVNSDFQGKRNLCRRKGYHDAFHDPGAASQVGKIFTIGGGATLVANYIWGNVCDETHGIRGLDRYFYEDNRPVKNLFQYDQDRFTIFATRDDVWDVVQITVPLMTTAPAFGATITHAGTGDTGIVIAASVANTTITLYDTTVGGGTWPAGNVSDGGGGILVPDPVAMTAHAHFAFDMTHTYDWRNPGVPVIRRLELPILDRRIWDSVVPDAFSDVNSAAFEGSRFWTYAVWGLLGESQSFLIGSCGGHYIAPGGPTVPLPWSTVAHPPGANINPPAGSFNVPYIHRNCLQRRTLVWWPDWYGQWAAANSNPNPALAPQYPLPPDANNDIGMFSWYAPFIWYYEPYDVTHNLVLTLDTMTAIPTAGATITQAVTAATMTVLYSSLVNNTIVGQDLLTGTWDADPAHTISDGGGGTLAPDPAIVVHVRNKDYDEFYAEPCGAFMRVYHECLFMAKIERTELTNAGYQTPGVLQHVFSPNEVMYSFPGIGSALQLGSSTTPPIWPFAIPDEPDERPWGCADPHGYPLNRIAYAEPRGVGTIAGLEIWNETLYVFKPEGITAVYGNHPTNFIFQNLGMSQGPMGRFAWVKTDMGIYYCTKNGMFLFRGNAADALVPVSTPEVSKIFSDDIDYPSATDYNTGEIIGVSMGWDREKNEILISYPKGGEQGEQGQPPAGCPTRTLIYDITGDRWSESVYKLPEDSGVEPVGIGIMKGGTDPTDDDYFMITHPIGNFLGGNDNGRLLFRGNIGDLDADTLDVNGCAEHVGNHIPFYVSTKDMTLGSLTPKVTVEAHRSVIYATNGVIHQRSTYNYHDINNELDLVYQTNDADNFIQTTIQRNKKVIDRGASNEKDFDTISCTWYSNDENPMPLRLTLPGMTGVPAIGATLVQTLPGTDATLVVTSVDLVNHYVWGTDQHTGVWNTVNVVNGGGMTPVNIVPSALAIINNPLVDNPDTPIQFVAHSLIVKTAEGEVR